MAMGSRRVTPTAPVMAAVVPEARPARTKTPCCQLSDSYTSGATRARLPPKINAAIGTPAGSSHFGEMRGACRAGTVYREFGCAIGPLSPADILRPCQSASSEGTSAVIPSHQGSREAVMATLVNIVFRFTALITFGLVSALVPGATPKNPAPGLIACK